jgi:hypothetical protein
LEVSPSAQGCNLSVEHLLAINVFCAESVLYRHVQEALQGKGWGPVHCTESLPADDLRSIFFQVLPNANNICLFKKKASFFLLKKLNIFCFFFFFWDKRGGLYFKQVVFFFWFFCKLASV